jgi:tripartite-type tricarboxylate transporter receptor subunit TctC
MAGIDTVHVPYKGGAPMMTDLIAGHIDRNQRLGPAAHQGGLGAPAGGEYAATSPFFPGLPTLDEAGLKGYDVTRGTGCWRRRERPPR